MSTSEAVTAGIRIEVRSEYVEERSDPLQRQWFFAYHIRITNESKRAVRLISRHWVITDAHGEEEHIQGPGVIGEQPLIQPDGSYEYTSFCPLGTSFGTMAGSYQMVDPDDDHFDVEIAPFTLCEPYAVN
jgi:ApaG protein